MTRPEARVAILEAANRHRRDRNVRGLGRTSFLSPPLYMRHLQQAVAIVRHNGLVRPGVLVTAGFRPERAR